MFSGSRFFGRPDRPQRRRSRQDRRERQRKLLVESLEDRRLLATRIWDGGGGDSLWSTAANWDGDATTPVSGDALVFAGGTGLTPINDLVAGRQFTAITFSAGASSFVLSGNAITLTGAVTNNGSNLQTINLAMVMSATRSFDTASGNLAVGGSLSGGGGLTKAGPNTLTLSGDNAYSGDTLIDGGTLRAEHNNAVGTGTVQLRATGSTMELAQGITISRPLSVLNNGDNKVLRLQNGAVSAEYAGAITISEFGAGNFDLIADVSGTLSVSGTIGGGSAGIVKLGAGTLVLSNPANNYTAATRIQNGVLKLGADDVLPNNASNQIPLYLEPITDGATATLDLAGHTDAIDSLTLGSGAPGVAGLTAQIIDSVGGGLLRLEGASAQFTYNRGSVAVHNGSATISAGLDLNGFNRTFGVNDSNVTTEELVISGVIQDSSGPAGITKSGAGELVLSGDNTYRGATAVNSGTLVARHANALGTTAGSTTVTDGETLTIDNVTSPEAISIEGETGSGALRGTGTAAVTGTVTLTANSSIGAPGSGDTLTLSGPVMSSNNSALTKVGAGTVVLGSTDNSYGKTTISAGTLRLGASGVIPEGADIGALDISASATLDLAGHDQKVSGLTGSGTVDNSAVDAATLTLGTGNDNDIFEGVVTDTGGTVNLTKLGSGTQTLQGAQPFTNSGLTLVTAGTLKLAARNKLAAGSTLEVAGLTAEFSVNELTGSDPAQTVAGVTLTQGTITGGSDALVSASPFALKKGIVNANLGGAAGVSKTTADTVVLRHDSSYTGVTYVTAGTLELRDQATLGSPGDNTVVSGGATLHVNNIATAEPLVLNGLGFAAAGALTAEGANAAVSGSVTLASDASIGVAAGGVLALSGQVTGAGGLTKVGAGRLNLSNTAQTNDYAGDTIISAGTLLINTSAPVTNNANQIPDGPGKGNVVVNGTLDLSGGNERINGLSGSGSVDHSGSGARTLTVGLKDQTSSFGGTLQDTGTGTLGLTKTGSGTLTLSGGNTYAGETTVQQGILVLGSATALGTAVGGTTVDSGATLSLQNGLAYAEPLTLNGTGFSGSGALRSAAGANTWTGTIGVATSSSITVADGLTLNLNGTVTHNGTTLTLAGPGSFAVAGQLTGGSGDSNLIVDGAAVTLSAANNNYNGTTSVYGGGVLSNGAANALPATTTLTLGNAANTAGTYDLHGYDQTLTGLNSAGSGTQLVTNSGAGAGTNTLTVTGSGSFAGVIQDGATAHTALTKSTGGTLTLSGVNTYTGATAVTGGALWINGSTAAASAVTVSNGGTLGGTGVIYGTTSVNSGGTLAPGNSIETLEHKSGLTLADGASYLVEVTADYNTSGVDGDEAIVTGAVTLGTTVGSGPALTISDLSHTIPAPAGAQLTIISNDAAEDVAGKARFQNLDDGAWLVPTQPGAVNRFYVSYYGGDGNDVTLTIYNPSTTTVTGTGDFLLRRRFNTVQVLLAGSVIGAWPYDSLSSLTINGGPGNDNLVIDRSNGDPIPTGGVFFNAGEAGGDDDGLTIQGGSATNLVYTPFDPAAPNVPGSGRLALDLRTVTFTGLEPTLVTVVPTNVTIDMSSLAAGEDLTIQNTGAADDGQSFANFANTDIEDLSFTNPTASLLIIGSGLADTIHVNALDTLDGDGNALDATVTVQAGNGNDVIDWNAKTSNGTYTFQGQGGADELQGLDVAQTWSITAANTGNVGGAAYAAFDTLEKLIGGTADDNFRLASSVGSFNGTIDGGSAGSDTLAVTNGTNTFGLSGLNAGTLNTTTLFSNIDVLTGGTGSDEIVGSSGSDVFSITGANAGSVAGMNFSSIEALDGGASDDSFTLASGISSFNGTINGGSAGSDTLAVTDGTNTFALSASNAGTLNTSTPFTNIDVLTGGSGSDGIVGTGINDAFNITGANAGSVAGMSFSSIETLDGGAGDDSFTLASGVGTFSGTINGGSAGSDTLAVTDGTNTFSLNASNTGTLNTSTLFTNIDVLAGGSGSDGIVGTAGNDTFSISGANAGSVAGLSFSSIETLDGGAGDDSFALASGVGTFSGTINGGSAGSDTLAATNGTNTFALSGLNAGTLNATTLFSNIDVLTGGTGSDEIVGTSGNDTFSITGANAGSVAGMTFSLVEALDGGVGDDSFTLAAGVNSFNGTVNGGSAGSDTLAATNGANTFALSGSNAGTLNVSTVFSNIDVLNGGADNDQIVGTAGDDTFSVTGANAGGVVGITFTGIESVDGAAGDDRFLIGAGGSLSGNLAGGLGSNTLDYSTYGSAVMVDLDNTTAPGAPGILGTIASLQNFLGSLFDDDLSVDALAAGVTRNVDGNAGTTSNVLRVDAQGQIVTDNGTTFSFSGGYGTITYDEFQTVYLTDAASLIVAGSGADDGLVLTPSSTSAATYRLNSGPTVHFGSVASFTFNAGAGADTLTIESSALTDSVFAPSGGIFYHGGTGSDRLNLSGGGGAAFQERYWVGTTDVAAAPNRRVLGEGTLETTNGTTSQTIRFTGLEPINDDVLAADLTVYGTDAAEAITVSDEPDDSGARVRVAVGLYEPIDFSNKGSLIVRGGDNAAGGDAGDTITVNFANTPVALTGVTIHGDEGDDAIGVQSTSSNISLAIYGDAGAADSVSFTTADLTLTGSPGLTLSVATAETIDVNRNLTALGGITFTNPTTTYLGGNLQTDGTSIAITGGTVVLDVGPVALDTELGGSGDAGAVALGGTTITANGANPDLTIDASAPGLGGTVTLGPLTNAGGAYVDDLRITAAGATDGGVDLTGSVRTGGFILVEQAATVGIAADVWAGTSLTIRDLGSTLELSAGVDLTAGNGPLSVVTGVPGIILSGPTGSTNVIDGNGDAPVTLAAVTATNSPNLTVNSEGSISLASVNLGASGNLAVNVNNNGPGGASTGGFGTLNAGTIAVTGSDGGDVLTFNGLVTSHEAAGVTVQGGTIEFNAAVDSTDGGGLVSVAGRNAVTFYAGTGVNAGGTIAIAANQDGAGAEGLTQASDATIQTADTGANAIRLTVNTGLGGTGNALIAALVTGAGGTVTVAANGGAIVDNNVAAVNLTAGQAVLSAAAGIGNGNSLETNVNTLSATNTGLGNIEITEVAAGGGLGVQGAVHGNAAGDIVLTTTDGTLTVLGGGSGVSTLGGGALTLTANGSGQDVIVNALVSGQAGTVTVRAAGGNGSHVQVNAPVSTVAGPIFVRADQDITGSAAGTISSGAGGGDITIHADYDPASVPDDVGTIQLSGDITGGTGNLIFSLTACDGWLGATPGAASGNILSGGTLTKNGAGTLRLNGNANTYSGSTTINGGYLLVNGRLTQSAMMVFGSNLGTLGGIGTIDVNTLTVDATGRVDPGEVVNCLPQPGRLTIDGNVWFRADSTFNLQLNGIVPGTGYDQLRVDGTVDLSGTVGGADGSFLTGTSTGLPVGAELRIIDNDATDAIDTRFDGLKEGDFVSTFGPLMNISYRAGTGNDVVLSTPGRYDFNGYNGYTAPTWTPVSPYQSKVGSTFGWQTLPERYFERNYPMPPPYTTAQGMLHYDGHSTNRWGAPITFLVDVAAAKTYEVMILSGDAGWNHDREKFTAVGSNGTTATVQVDTWGAGAPDGSGVLVTWGGGVPNTQGTGYYRWIRLTVTVGGNADALGQLAVTMEDLGGWDSTAVILAMDVRPVAAVGRIDLERTATVYSPADATSPFSDLPADGVTVDTYHGTGAPPNAKLTLTVSAGTPVQYTTVTTDEDPTMWGTQVTADASGGFSFSIQRPATLTNTPTPAASEDWTILAEEVSGLSRGTAIQTYVAPAAEALRFDFGIYGSPVQTYGADAKKFLEVIPQMLYTPTRGYGWNIRVAGAWRKDPGMSNLRTDLNYARDATFKVDLPDGWYNVRIYHSNPRYYGTVSYVADNFQVWAEDVLRYTVDDIAPGTTWKANDLAASTFRVQVTGGTLDLRFVDVGGRDGNFVVSGIDISTGTLPAAALLAAGNPRDQGAAAISLATLTPAVAEAAARWSDAGLSAEQAATLATARFAVADLGGAVLGLADPATNTVRIDDDAAMIGWSVGSGQASLVTGQWSVVSGERVPDAQRRVTKDGIDLLTVVMHELGHLLGYEHSEDPHGLMAPVLGPGLPDARAFPASPAPAPHQSPAVIPWRTEWLLDENRVFAELTRDSGEENPGDDAITASLLDPATDTLHAAQIAKSSEEASQARVPRRSRLERFERELDAWFAELAAEEAGGG